MNEYLLLSSLLILGLTPLTAIWMEKHPKVALVVGAAFMVGLVAIVVFDVIPSSFQHNGYLTIVMALLGFAMTYTMERPLLQREVFGTVAKVLVCVFFVVHTIFDGASLYLSVHHDELLAAANAQQFHNHHAIGVSVLMHRLILCNLLWVLLKKFMPMGFMILMFSLMAVGTLIGYYFSPSIAGGDPQLFYMVEAFVGGGLLHVNLDFLAAAKRALRSA